MENSLLGHTSLTHTLLSDSVVSGGSRNMSTARLSGGSTSSSSGVKASSGGAGKTKRPAWDLKGRLQDMEERLRSHENEKMDFNAQVTSAANICYDRMRARLYKTARLIDYTLP